MERRRVILLVVLGFSLIFAFVSNYLDPFEAYGTDTGNYYSSEYLSFSHNPFQKISHINKLNPSYNESYNYSYIVSATFFNGDGVVVEKPVDTNQSAYDTAFKYEELGNNGNVSDNSSMEPLEIAGVTGYKVDSLNYFDNGDLASHTIDVFFVKNGKLYQITFFSFGRDTINQNQEDINKILSSFTVN